MATRRRQRWHPPKCKVCGALAADGNYISSRGFCEGCGTTRTLIAQAALRATHTAAEVDAQVRAAREQLARAARGKS